MVGPDNNAYEVTTGWEKAPTTIGMSESVGQFGRNWNSITAVGGLGCFPLIIIFIFLQRILVQGMTEGAVSKVCFSLETALFGLYCQW
jgi:multiple sugar transport system permease protein